ncbi:hypothetical protein BU197_01355 [Streptomyces sp. CBMA291]|nr:hypothetical protein [Streptomyces sp. CBMA291]MBD0713598.1 hypothetical protein [Streptomyces sp. CBMA370]
MSKNTEALVPVATATVRQPVQGDVEPSAEEPTGAATVTIFAVPEGPGITVSVPASSSGHMLESVTCLGVTAASMLGPIALLKVVPADWPWPVGGGLALLLALMPLAYVLLSTRRLRRK